MESRYRALAGVPLFATLGEGRLRALAALARDEKFSPGDVLLEQGTEGRSLLVVVSGYLKVVSTDADGRESLLGLEAPGSVIGEIALLDGGPRSASIVALERCEVVLLEGSAVLDFLRDDPQASIALLSVLAARLRRLSQRTEDVAFQPIPVRLARRLLHLADAYGVAAASGCSLKIRLRLSQQELGASIDATRESVNKHLRAWEEEGIVAKDDGYMVILKPTALRGIAFESAS